MEKTKGEKKPAVVITPLLRLYNAFITRCLVLKFCSTLFHEINSNCLKTPYQKINHPNCLNFNLFIVIYLHQIQVVFNL